MTNRVLLNNIDHRTLRVITRRSAEFGDNINQALVFPTEFEELQREYPIFFRRDASGDFQSVVLLGLDRDENLFLDETGWQARYIPAVQERGPFLIGFHKQTDEARNEPMIHVDLDHPRISRTEGEPVFMPHGGNSPYLNGIAQTLKSIHQGTELARPMFAALEAEGLIEPVAVEIALDDTTRYKLPGLHTIGADRLAQLDAAGLERLHKAGFLHLAFCVVVSLGNVRRLIDL